MFKKIFILSRNDEIVCNDFPNTCPVCKQIEDPEIIFAHRSDPMKNRIRNHIIAICECLNCNSLYALSFILKHKNDHPIPTVTHIQSLPCSGENPPYSNIISDISPSFIKIYSQSIAARGQGLDELVGIGLRKSLEFLIKDYLAYTNPDKAADIQSKFLGVCINEYFPDGKIKTVAQRAAWLGNDHTHYIQRFEDKDIEDLIKLIHLTIHWIAAELETAEWSLLEPRN